MNFISASLIKIIQDKKGLRRYVGPKRIIVFLILISTVYFSRSSFDALLLIDFFSNFLVDHPYRSIFLFIFGYTLCVVLLLPTLPLNLAAGYFWGGAIGGLISTISVTFGAVIAFVLARYLFGQPLSIQFKNEWLRLIKDGFDKNGYWFVALARINPIVPTGPLNYLLGLTSMKLRTYSYVSFIAIFIPSLFIAYLGDFFQTFNRADNNLNAILLNLFYLSACATLLISVRYFFKIYKKG